MSNIDKLVDSILYNHGIEDAKKKFKKKNAIIVKTSYGKLFVDDKTGECYLFDDNGNLDDINKVKRIECSAFENCTSLKNIKIPDSVEGIEAWAFYNCTSLKSIKIPSSVKYIGYGAFDYCISLKEVVFKGKTIDQVKVVLYPFGIKDELGIKDKSIIKVES